MRGEGTCTAVNWSTAEFRAWRSCTPYFTTETQRIAGGSKKQVVQTPDCDQLSLLRRRAKIVVDHLKT